MNKNKNICMTRYFFVFKTPFVFIPQLGSGGKKFKMRKLEKVFVEKNQTQGRRGAASHINLSKKCAEKDNFKRQSEAAQPSC